MPLRSISLTLLSCFTLLACSSAPIDPTEFAGKFKDKLTTDIRADGLKLFTYQAGLAEEYTARDVAERPFPHEERMRQVAQDPREQRRFRQAQEDELEIWGRQVELGLEKTLEMTGYCREGYFELSRMIESGRGEIRGECKEGATEEDKQKFVRF
ncbi:hypothetical protein HRJ35_15570 [Shewanella oneidensis MR-1]|uniref:Predicted lipoprotein n=1 Tax=Shewanella oneidensis (strain ATCC 700550 / JCM 31522 / CIP 106686 / LMG 19005 / NCIMB 14063 / MR-1) TaxID=211586 RepID=Q8EDF3_SHEON|nr:hypothetical protein [Shewanella oneidensis]AAN55821.1 predicted lipoprotein [Shewanella oneidensis MR-1]MDX5995539.1 hypothetical protein [Shewanella oneidensis]MEE2027745.1 hypothetical protein [Shewanella oneidensis]QKG97286.1 hypothetical protein HRJ35_15570 [Shewanella oneidensis MR-1]